MYKLGILLLFTSITTAHIAIVYYMQSTLFYCMHMHTVYTYLYGGQMANVKKSSTALMIRAPVPSLYVYNDTTNINDNDYRLSGLELSSGI